MDASMRLRHARPSCKRGDVRSRTSSNLNLPDRKAPPCPVVQAAALRRVLSQVIVAMITSKSSGQTTRAA